MISRGRVIMRGKERGWGQARKVYVYIYIYILYNIYIHWQKYSVSKNREVGGTGRDLQILQTRRQSHTMKI